MRGKRLCSQTPTVGNRITPAYAGKTTSGKLTTTKSAGSPPRMRGKLRPALRSGFQDRITPAYAGKTRTATASPFAETDHPRVCGENFQDISCYLPFWGSPPRMRGKHSNHTADNCNQRITPAYAGKTGMLGAYDKPFQDHPRVCGENLHTADAPVRIDGSPPRMRGKHNPQNLY